MNLDVATQLCREFEGWRSKPYLCAAGVPTIAFGATRYQDGRSVTLKDAPITREAGEELLRWHLEQECLPAVLRLCPSLIAHPAAANALCSFVFNLGAGRLQSSTLRRRINQGDWAGAKEQIMRWTRGGGRVLPGLVRRRQAEAALIGT